MMKTIIKFFFFVDVNGDGFLDFGELEALFVKEVCDLTVWCNVMSFVKLIN